MGSTIFFSDVHLCSEAMSTQGYAWFRPKHQARLVRFLDHVVERAEKGEVDALVMLGDVFDRWTCPRNVAPPTWEEILEAPGHQPIFERLESIASHTEVSYVHGNHDFDLPAARLNQRLPSVKVLSVFRRGPIYAEHGQDHTLFNNPAITQHPGVQWPPGFFITRATLRSPIPPGSFGAVLSYLDDAVGILARGESVKHVLEACFEAQKLGPDDTFVMESGAPMTVKEVLGLYDRAYPQVTLGSLVGRAQIEGDLLLAVRPLIDRLFKAGQPAPKVIVMGHTHHPRIDRRRHMGDEYVYANSGSWCEGAGHGSFVEVRPDGADKLVVQLYAVADDGPVVRFVDERHIQS